MVKKEDIDEERFFRQHDKLLKNWLFNMRNQDPKGVLAIASAFFFTAVKMTVKSEHRVVILQELIANALKSMDEELPS